jgi:hypothetical protein
VAIENYTPSVKVGNTTALNTARAAFATYLVTIHNRIHPVFAEQFLGTLANLPKSHPLNLNQDLSVHLEIVLNKDTGKRVRIGVTKASGLTVFDLGCAHRGRSGRPLRQGTGRHRVPGRQRLPALGVPPRSVRRLHNPQRPALTS